MKDVSIGYAAYMLKSCRCSRIPWGTTSVVRHSTRPKEFKVLTFGSVGQLFCTCWLVHRLLIILLPISKKNEKLVYGVVNAHFPGITCCLCLLSSHDFCVWQYVTY